MPYLRRYKLRIVFGLLGVLLMGIIGNVIPLATGVITDTLAGNPVPFEHSSETHARVVALVPGLTGSRLSRSIPYYQPNSRRTLGIYCLIIIVCVSFKGFLSFLARWRWTLANALTWSGCSTIISKPLARRNSLTAR